MISMGPKLSRCSLAPASPTASWAGRIAIEPEYCRRMECAVVGSGDYGRAAAIGRARAGAEIIAIDRRMDRLNLVKDEAAMAGSALDLARFVGDHS
jgi:threonine dehydrogenase-like Zn-dependent dehydrogenase